MKLIFLFHGIYPRITADTKKWRFCIQTSKHHDLYNLIVPGTINEFGALEPPPNALWYIYKLKKLG